MKALSLTNKILLAFALSLAVAYYFLVLPQVRATAQALGELDMLRDTVTVSGTAKQRETFRAEAQALQEQVTALLPASDEQYDLAVQVEDLAKATNLSVTGLTVNAVQGTGQPKTAPSKEETAAGATPTSGPLKVTTTVTVSGTYADIIRFTEGLTNLERFMQIDQVAFTQAVDEPLSAQVTAFAYYQP